jgi:ABC-2 type transport system permease protein
MSTLRTLRWSVWLGWQIESNWAEPWLFAVYMLVKPLAGSLLLVGMFLAARALPGSRVSDAYLPFLYVGNACYALVGLVLFGLANVVYTDREHYGMLKYIFISPARLRAYFVGRGLARAGEAAAGALINLGFGAMLFPGSVGAALARGPAWGWLALYLVLGLVMLVSLGLLLVAAVLNMARNGMFLSEGLAGAMYLVCGVVVPLGTLPGWVQWLGLALPPTYWLEGVRRALIGPAPEALPSPLAAWSHPQLALAVAASTAVLAVASHYAFRWGQRRAWRDGRIEETSGV